MSAETTLTNTTDEAYENAVRKQRVESEILAHGEDFDQTRLDAIMSHNALEQTVISPQAADILADLTIPETEEDTDIAIAEAARRQMELKTLYAKQDLEERAAREDWSEDKYQQELANITK